MTQIAIHKFDDQKTMSPSLLERTKAMVDAIRRRAFELFERRNGSNGTDLDDWLQAEREVAFEPAELVDEDKAFKARVALPGFEAKDIEVSATPDAILIQAESAHTHEGCEGDVCFCEFSGKNVFRRFDLPAPVDVDKVTATVDKGILQVTAPKAKTKEMAVVA